MLVSFFVVNLAQSVCLQLTWVTRWWHDNGYDPDDDQAILERVKSATDNTGTLALYICKWWNKPQSGHEVGLLRTTLPMASSTRCTSSIREDSKI